MARINGSGFKMKGSPLKGKLGDILRSVGVDLKAGQKDRGIFSEKGKAEKKSRKAGESKYQTDVRRGREERKVTRADVASDAEFFGEHRKAGTTPGTPITPKKEETSKIPTTSAQEMINMAYKGTNDDWNKASKNAMDMYGTTLTELIGKRDSPVEKKSPYKKGIGSYAKKAKGSRGYKMKRRK